MSQIKELLGKRIKELRLARKLTQEQLAEIINIGAASLSKIEIGMNRPTDENLEKIAQALNVEPYQLYMCYHFKNIDEIKKELHSMINNANENDIRLAYKIFNGIIN